MLWHSGFICSKCFSDYPQLGLFSVKSANIKSSCIRDACAGRNSARDSCVGGAFVTGICTGVAYLGDNCIGGAYAWNTSAGDTYIKIAGICAWDAGIKSACTKITFARGAWIKITCTRTASIIVARDVCAYTSGGYIGGADVRDDCIKDACVRNVGAVKRLGIYLQLSQILELKQYNLTLEIWIGASW